MKRLFQILVALLVLRFAYRAGIRQGIHEAVERLCGKSAPYLAGGRWQ